MSRRHSLTYLGLVSRLGEGRQPENQWTEVLAATLAESPTFLAGFLRLCGRQGTDSKKWSVRTQESRAGQSGGRDQLDMTLRDHMGTRIVVEVKRGAALTLAQLKRYRTHATSLVALTERHPEPTITELRRHGIIALRWSQLHHLATTLKPSSSGERFVLAQFARYLEEAGMAHRAITASNIAELHRLFRELQADLGSQERGVGRAFATAHAIVEEMWGIRKELAVSTPKGTKWSGPVVGAYSLGDDKQVRGKKKPVYVETDRGYEIGCALHRGKRYLDFSFAFPLKGARRRPMLTIGVWDEKSQDVIGTPATYLIPSLTRKGTIDWGIVTERCRAAMTKQLVHLTPRKPRA